MAARKTTRNTTRNTEMALAPVSKALAPVSAFNNDWKQRLAKYAERDAATATGATGWQYIGTKGGVFKFNEEPLEELPPMFILGAMFENAYYEGTYDPDSPSAPKCFALARREEELAPPEKLKDARQCLQGEPASDNCAGCWANVFGSAQQGRGKACKNIRRLALLPADRVDAQTLSEVEGAMLRLPVTSVKHYSTFANKVTRGLGIPLFIMRVRIGIEPDPKSQFKITFTPYDMQQTREGPVPLLVQDSDILTVLEQRVKEADTYLEQEPNLSNDEDEKPASRSKSRAQVPARRAAPKPSGRVAPKKAGSRAAGSAPTQKF